jgi:hypothetical protein
VRSIPPPTMSGDLAGSLWARLPQRERRGSRARCILLTHGSKEVVARRLSALIAPYDALIDPIRHCWMPRGFTAPREARLGDAIPFLSNEHREAMMCWWLAVREGANTPNWDIASTATIGGAEGLLLVEAKAHAAEIKNEGKSANGHADNHVHIGAACRDASTALNSILPGWTLSAESHYQLCNRFAWCWKLASLGIPVILVYLGFLRADEMSDQGRPIATSAHWECLVRDHSQGVAPATVWDETIWVNKTPIRALIRSVDVHLDPSP